MNQIIKYLNRIDLKLFFRVIIPVSILAMSLFVNYFLNSMSISDTLRITLFEIMFPYLTGAIWIFLYSKIREVFIDKRNNKDFLNPLNAMFTFNENYMNMDNYRLFVFAAWVIFGIVQFAVFFT